MLDMLVLEIGKKLHDQRSYSSIYHMLKGKKSAQTIQDIHLFSLHPYFSLLPKWTKDSFQHCLHSLQAKEYIEMTSDIIHVTVKGIAVLETDKPLFPHFHGWKFHKVAKQRWNRLSLFIQVISQALHKNRVYLPVVQDEVVQIEVKKVLASLLKEERLTDVAESLYRECQHIFAEMDENQEILLYKMSGYAHRGLAMYQLAQKWGVNEWEIQLVWLHAWHEWMHIYESSHTPTLDQVFATTNAVSLLTSSTEQSKWLLDQGNSIEDVARIRGLKQNTIEDHVIELAIVDDSFELRRFVSEEAEEEIYGAINRLKVGRLKPIKEAVSDHISYFHIRLCIARRSRYEFT